MAPAGSKNTPETKARINIDRQLEQAGWLVQDRDEMNLASANAIAVREFKLAKGHGYVDYLLFLDGHAVGVCEAKPAGVTLTSVEPQAQKYVEGLPAGLDAPHKPLPFAYISTGEETVFFNDFDPRPRSRQIFTFHRPDTLREWLTADTLDAWIKRTGGAFTAADDTKPSTLRARLRAMPTVALPGMWPNKVRAVVNIEKSLFDDRPRSLIQMATGTGKTLLAVTTLYRLIKFGGARRVLFLVDRDDLGSQAEKEFKTFRTPDDNRKFEELYSVQRLSFVVLVADERFVDVGSGLQCGVEAASESRERLPVGAGVGTARVVDPRLHTLEVARSAAALFAEVDGHAEILPRWRSAVNAMLGHQRRRVSATLERHEAEAERAGRRRAPTCSGGAQGPAHGSESHHGRRLPLLAIGRRGRREAARDRAARAGRVRRRAPSLGLAQRRLPEMFGDQGRAGLDHDVVAHGLQERPGTSAFLRDVGLQLGERRVSSTRHLLDVGLRASQNVPTPIDPLV